MLFIDGDQVHEACIFHQLIDSLAEQHRSSTDRMQDMLMMQPTGQEADNAFFIRAAWQFDQVMGAKIISILPGNQVNHLPAIQAVYILLDGKNGAPLAAIDGTAMTYFKTAADSALGARYLARHNVNTLLIVGTGDLAPYLIEAHCAARPSINQVLLWNRTTGKALNLAENLSDKDYSVAVIDDLEAAVDKADIVCCATRSADPVIVGRWLNPGTHVDLVGAYTPDMREADDETLRRGSIFVNARATTIGEIGELIIPMQNGVISESDILADHFDFCQGKHPGRESDEQITIFKNGGGGHLDLMTARFIHEQALLNNR